MSASMAEVLLAHWAHNCGPDKCTCSCGEPIKHWGDGIDANEALAAHQEAVLAANGYGNVREAQEVAWAKGATSAGLNLMALQAAGINPNPYRRPE